MGENFIKIKGKKRRVIKKHGSKKRDERNMVEKFVKSRGEKKWVKKTRVKKDG